MTLEELRDAWWKDEIERFAARFWEQVEKTETCWLWTGYLAGGYGRITFEHTFAGRMPAHRASMLLHHGEIPEGKFVLHKCDNRLCVRPDHLFFGTQQENIADMHAKGRSRVAIGEHHGFAKLTEAQVREIRSIKGVTTRAMAETFGVSHGQISRIRLRYDWKHVS